MSTRISKRRRPGLIKKQSSAPTLKELTDVEDELDKAPHRFVKNGPLSKNGSDAEKFRAFQRCIGLLDLKLQSFTNAIRQLGSSVGLLDATTHIQDRLPKLLRLFQDNASKLFDTGIAPHNTDVQANLFDRNPRRSDSWKQTRKGSKAPNPRLLNVSCFPDQLESLAKELLMFIDRLNDVPEFVDEAVHTTHGPVIEVFKAFAGDLRYRADCLSEFGEKLHNAAITRHINELTEDFGSYADHVGVPAIRYSQERTATHLQNLSTV
ncbi:unnamed protein product, partial [Rhizoctonia solani]